jgi:hypothetical protein
VRGAVDRSQHRVVASPITSFPSDHFTSNYCPVSSLRFGVANCINSVDSCQLSHHG